MENVVKLEELFEVVGGFHAEKIELTNIIRGNWISERHRFVDIYHYFVPDTAMDERDQAAANLLGKEDERNGCIITRMKKDVNIKHKALGLENADNTVTYSRVEGGHNFEVFVNCY